ncbi:MAG TPA: hypothetical protein VEI97_09735 [bacterium]|nr:hypothetical protein [bacterium]
MTLTGNALRAGFLTLALAIGICTAQASLAGDHTHEGEGKGEKACCALKGEKTAEGVKLAACDHEHEEGEHAHARPADAPRVGVALETGFYPVSTCPVTGETLAPDHFHRFEVDGREVVTCCPGCETRFREDLTTFTANLDTMITEQQSEAYPLTTCPVAGEELGEKASSLIVNNYLVKVCCAGCGNKVKADPAKYTAELAAFWAEVPQAAVTVEEAEAEMAAVAEAEAVEVAQAEE